MKNKINDLASRYRILLIYLFGSQADKGRRYIEDEDVVPDLLSDLLSDLDVAVVFEGRIQESHVPFL